MKKIALFTLMATTSLFGIRTEQTHRNGNRKNQGNRPPVIGEFGSTMTTLALCPWSPDGSCSASGRTLALWVNATDPDGDVLEYKYSTTAGRIKGTGPRVWWILEDLPVGSYVTTVKVSDRRGGQTIGAVSVNIVVCGSCDPPPPPCPKITVSCPNRVGRGRLIGFSATIKSSRPYGEPSYTWSINAGRIVSGQYTRHLEVDTTAFPFENITATVTVGGFDPACQRKAACSSMIKH
jgi:hypothetical protein